MLDELKLNQACREIHREAIRKGFSSHDLPTDLMLVVTELAEACEADRKEKYADLEEFEAKAPRWITAKGCKPMVEPGMTEEEAIKKTAALFEEYIKDILEDEIADAIIRLMDLCGKRNIDIEKHIELKVAYNITRPYKHGKRY